MFKLYSCKIRLGGNVQNEIRKIGVTAPEIEVYRALHGSDAVLDIVEAGSVKRTDREERERIESIFASPANSMGDSLAKRQRMLSDLFGHARNPLPKHLDDGSESDVDPATPIVRTRVIKEKAPAFAE
jgi:hypothetical protein